MVVPTAYLAPMSYYSAIVRAGEKREGWNSVADGREDSIVEVEQWESFPKQTYRNRCVIAGTNGVQMLSIPVGKCERKQYTRDVKITYQDKWQHRHWMALVSAYQHTPYFAYYEDLFRPFYEQRYEYLMDYNEALHDVVMRLLGRAQVKMTRTKDWAQEELEQYWEGATKPYYQIFADRHGFENNLSIVDVLFNMGPEAILYL